MPPRAALVEALRRVAPEAAARIGPFIRPCAAFEASGEPRLGGARLGGLPDLSDAIAWPTRPARPDDPEPVRRLGHAALDFIVQIDLGAAAGLHDLPLPDHGRLVLFYDAIRALSGADGDHAPAWRLIHDAAPVAAARPRERPIDAIAHPRFAAVELAARARFDMPDPAAPVWRRAIAPDFPNAADAIAASNEPAFSMLRTPPLVQLGGAAHGYQGRAGEDIAAAAAPFGASGPDSWRLVLQIDTGPHSALSWGRDTRLVVMMRGDDLLDGEFASAWAVRLGEAP